MFLTKAEVQELTGYKFPSKQKDGCNGKVLLSGLRQTVNRVYCGRQ